MEQSQQSSLTREPVTPIVESSSEVSKEQQPITDGGSEPTPNELVNLGRPPYIVELMNARPAYETFDVKEQMSEIDAFIREGLEDSRVSYETALNGLKLNIKPTGDIYTDIAQIRDYVRLQNKIKSVIKEKEEFEAKSPSEMSSEELKRLLNVRSR